MDICYRCFERSPALKARFIESGVPGKCAACEKKRKRIVPACELADLFVGLSHLYEVAEPGQHFYRHEDEDGVVEGGDTGELLSQLLQDEWPIFADGMDSDVIDSILREVWPEYSSSDLYAKESFWDRHPDLEWESIKSHVKHERRFFHEESDCDFTSLPSLLKPFVKRLTTEITGGKWVRARIQNSPDKPFKLDEMGAPPRKRATPGRANPAGISYLYLASDPGTACAEVRAEPGHGVTVASFKIPGTIKVLDLATIMRGIDPFAHIDLKSEIEKSQLVRAFAEDLSRPVLAEDAPLDYVPTQYLSEYFVSQGFDAIRYRSSVARGTNLVLFRTEKARATKVQLFHVFAKELTLRELDKPRRPGSKRRT